MDNQNLKQQVFQLADSLHEEGIKPTIEKVCSALSQSKAKIAPLLREWKQLREEEQQRMVLERYQNSLTKTDGTTTTTASSTPISSTNNFNHQDNSNSPEQQRIQDLLSYAKKRGETEAAVTLQLSEKYKQQALRTENLSSNLKDMVEGTRQETDAFLEGQTQRLLALPSQYPLSAT